MIEAPASLKSYRAKDEDGPPGGGGSNPFVDFYGEKRSRDTHESKTDKDAYLFQKSKGVAAKLAYLGHILMENRHGLVVNAKVTQAICKAEPEAAVDLVDALGGTRRFMLGADKDYDTRGLVEELREIQVTSLFIGREKPDFKLVLTFAAYNLIRMRNLKRWCRVEDPRTEGLLRLQH